MANELCSENSSLGVSPRISFSYDLCQSDIAAAGEHVQQNHPMRSDSSSSSRSLISSSTEFDFCVRESVKLESSSADELFSDGKMIPTMIKPKLSAAQPKLDHHQTSQYHSPMPTTPAFNQCERNTNTAKEIKITSSNEDDEKQGCKSFWGFKRSSSCGSGYGSSLCPLPLLSRSNSTGSSSSSVKRSLFPKDGHNQKPKSASKKLYSSSSQSNSSASMGSYQKPPFKKGQYGSYGNRVPVTPVLNVPTVNLFGFGLIFSNGKDKIPKSLKKREVREGRDK